MLKSNNEKETRGEFKGNIYNLFGIDAITFSKVIKP